eukprot:jgi/Tetstr1/463114/TSEL_008048.t1
MSCEGRVPRRGLHVVEYPGVVADAGAAIDTMGGGAAVGAALRGGGGAALHLRFRPRDPLCHPLIGAPGLAVQPGTGGSALVLRMRASATAEGAGASNSDAEVAVVGHVASLTVFAGMADYQWVSPPVRRRRPWRAERTGRDFDKAPCDEETQSLCTVPAIFCRDDIPHDYAYEEAKVQGTLSKGQTERRPLLMAQWQNQDAVPVRLPAYVHADTPTDVRLRQLLARRPIWNTALLAKHFDAQDGLEIAMHRQCYSFRIGPWRGLAIQRGLDPRSDPACRRWQLLACRFPEGWAALPGGAALLERAKGCPELPRRGPRPQSDTDDDTALLQRLPQPDVLEVCSFRCLPVPSPTGEVLLQMADIGDATVQSMINVPPQEEKCDKVTGWLTDTALDQMTQIVEGHLRTLLEGGVVPLHHVDVMLRDEEGNNPQESGLEGAADAGGGGGAEITTSAPMAAEDMGEFELMADKLLGDADEYEIFDEDDSDEEGEEEEEDGEDAEAAAVQPLTTFTSHTAFLHGEEHQEEEEEEEDMLEEEEEEEEEDDSS